MMDEMSLKVILDTAKSYIGQDRRTYCDILIYDLLYEELTILRQTYGKCRYKIHLMAQATYTLKRSNSDKVGFLTTLPI